jgi:hypothetical protein
MVAYVACEENGWPGAEGKEHRDENSEGLSFDYSNSCAVVEFNSFLLFVEEIVLEVLSFAQFHKVDQENDSDDEVDSEDNAELDELEMGGNKLALTSSWSDT